MVISEKILQRLFGVSRQRLRYWRKIGLIPPYAPGKQKGYTFQDVVRIQIICALTEKGVQPSTIRDTLFDLRLCLHKKDALTGKTLYVCGKEIFIFKDGKAYTPRIKQYLLFEADKQKAILKDLIVQGKRTTVKMKAKKCTLAHNKHVNNLELIQSVLP